MDRFTEHTGIVAPMDRINVDTDQIIPKQFLKRIQRTGYGQFLFNDWRFKEDGSLNPDFELNKSGYQGASILVAGANFGSGSSREHAAWALKEYGFKCIIAPSFADIFSNNCFQNGILPITLAEDRVAQIIEKAKSLGVKRIKGEFISTSKNKPAENFYNNCGFKKIGDYWIFDTGQKIETPDHIKLRRNDE